MKCQCLFSEKNKKNIVSLSSAADSMLKYFSYFFLEIGSGILCKLSSWETNEWILFRFYVHIDIV